MFYSSVKGFEPVYNCNSKALILGSFPSVKSRAEGFYYANPRNRFWTILSAIFKENAGETIENKTKFLLKNGVALWDIAEICDIKGSDDNSISQVKIVELDIILSAANIKKVFLNGKKAYELYASKYKNISVPTCILPSSSPANAAKTVETLIKEWQIEFSTVF